MSVKTASQQDVPLLARPVTKSVAVLGFGCGDATGLIMDSIRFATIGTSVSILYQNHGTVL